MAGQAERNKLTPAQSKKLDGVVSGLIGSLKVKGDEAQKNLGRFADKYARFKLGIRGTGPHSHGFNAGQRKAIAEAVREGFGIKEAPRKTRVARPAAGKPAGKRGKGSTKRTTAQLARAQKARAEGSGGQPIPGTVVVRG